MTPRRLTMTRETVTTETLELDPADSGAMTVTATETVHWKVARFERSEDGCQTWEAIDTPTMRKRLAGTYRDVSLAIETMLTGQVIRTPFAHYRKDPES